MHTIAQSPEARAPDLFDPDGFLADAALWTEGLATQIAETDGLAPLTERHWRVIRHVRERYLRVGGLPTMRLVCRATNVPREEIRQLFGDCRTIWRIAGLPNPGEEAKAYF
jgi:tRNA 2-thiouridine synthesizing protein E